jgi:hypothetical protein
VNGVCYFHRCAGESVNRPGFLESQTDLYQVIRCPMPGVSDALKTGSVPDTAGVSEQSLWR